MGIHVFVSLIQGIWETFYLLTGILYIVFNNSFTFGVMGYRGIVLNTLQTLLGLCYIKEN